MTDDLLKRLRSTKAVGGHHCGSYGAALSNPDGPESALEIERLTAKLKTVLDREAETHRRHDARVDALEAERDAALAGAVKVKPLEWDERVVANGSATLATAELVLQYEAWGGGAWAVNLSHNLPKGGKSLEAAKTAAQADYERRILSALEPDPGRDAARAKCDLMASADALVHHLEHARAVDDVDIRTIAKMRDALATRPEPDPEPMRCAECDCENGGGDCTWIVTPDRDARLIRAALEVAHSAVAREAAPISGTPYSAGPRVFCDAIRAITPADVLAKMEDGE